MAQWKGQFSGRTHETRLAEAEAVLREALGHKREVHAEIPSATLDQLAEKVLFARVHLLKAKIDRAQHKPTEEHFSEMAATVDKWKARIEELEKGGVSDVLREFYVALE